MSFANPCQVAFPRLTDAEMQTVSTFGTVQRFADGQVLIEEGDKDFPFFVVKQGAIEIRECSTGVENLVAEHQPGEFSGDVDMLTRRAAIIRARAARGLEAIVVPADRMRRLLNDLPDLSDKLLDAFQMRRRILEDSSSGFVGVRLLGRSNSREAMRIQEFLYKNRVPHRFGQCGVRLLCTDLPRQRRLVEARHPREKHGLKTLGQYPGDARESQSD